jgi:hypothetical protein
MAPTREELELGTSVYHQVRFYEKSKKDLRGKAWIYEICGALIYLALILELKPLSHTDSLLVLAIPAYFALRIWINRQAKLQYATQKLLLLLLEEKYGEALPWVVEEKQLAQARELEVAAGQHPSPAIHS